MPTYKDVDAILQSLPNDLPYKGSVKRVIMQAPTADVVPKSEYERVATELERVEELYFRQKTLLQNAKSEYGEVLENWQKIHDSYTTDCIDHYNKGRQEVAREIFEEIETQLNEFNGSWADTVINTQYLIAELKKKYTEVEE